MPRIADYAIFTDATVKLDASSHQWSTALPGKPLETGYHAGSRAVLMFAVSKGAGAEIPELTVNIWSQTTAQTEKQSNVLLSNLKIMHTDRGTVHEVVQAGWLNDLSGVEFKLSGPAGFPTAVYVSDVVLIYQRDI